MENSRRAFLKQVGGLSCAIVSSHTYQGPEQARDRIFSGFYDLSSVLAFPLCLHDWHVPDVDRCAPPSQPSR